MAFHLLFSVMMESNQIFPILVFLTLFQVKFSNGRSHLPFLPTDEGIHVNDVISKRLDMIHNHGTRNRRNLVSTLSLLWPQVVGPIDNGIIKEESYDSVAKTALEHQLDGIRERSKIETATRQHVRDLLNFGTPIAKLTLQQMHALHSDMNTFWNHHNQFHPGHFHVNHHHPFPQPPPLPHPHHMDPAAIVIHHTIMDHHHKKNQPTKIQSIVINGDGIKLKTAEAKEKNEPIR